MKDKPPQKFASDGRLIVKKDAQGNPVEWQTVGYEFERAENGVPNLRQVIREDIAPSP